jgi:primase-polymerase (primpol)-like protein
MTPGSAVLKAAPALNGDRVPSERKQLPQWVLWQYGERKGRKTKVPYQVNGRLAKSNDPSTWAPYEDAAKVLEAYPEYAGLGFVFAKDDPYRGIDLDHALNGDGSLETWAAKIPPSSGARMRKFRPRGSASESGCAASSQAPASRLTSAATGAWRCTTKADSLW